MLVNYVRSLARECTIERSIGSSRFAVFGLSSLFVRADFDDQSGLLMCTARRTTWEEFVSEIVGAIFRNRSNRRNRQLSGLTNASHPLRLHHTYYMYSCTILSQDFDYKIPAEIQQISRSALKLAGSAHTLNPPAGSSICPSRWP